MDTPDNARGTLANLELVYHLDLPGRDNPEDDERAQYVITRALAQLVKEVQGAGSVEVKVLWDRRIWKPDGEGSLPRGYVWQLNMQISPEPVQPAHAELLQPLRPN